MFLNMFFFLCTPLFFLAGFQSRFSTKFSHMLEKRQTNKHTDKRKIKENKRKMKMVLSMLAGFCLQFYQFFSFFLIQLFFCSLVTLGVHVACNIIDMYKRRHHQPGLDKKMCVVFFLLLFESQKSNEDDDGKQEKNNIIENYVRFLLGRNISNRKCSGRYTTTMPCHAMYTLRK